MNCETCELVTRRDEGAAPYWDAFFRTEFFDLVHCNSSSLVGWLVLVHRVHISAIDEMSEEASVQLGLILRAASQALKIVTHCEKTYVMQFAEAPGHGHVHFHIVPRMHDILDADKGANVFNFLKVEPDQYATDEEMNRVTHAISDVLQADPTISRLGSE